MRIYTVDEIRELDKMTIEEFGVPSNSLMEVAGHKVYEEIIKKFGSKNSIFVLCGHGNNGGDGLVIARLFLIGGAKVSILLIENPDRCSPDFLKNFEILKKVAIRFPDLEIIDFNNFDREILKQRILKSDLIIDALLGTGIRSELKGNYKTIVSLVNSLGVSGKVVAVDIPTGLNGDTGSPVSEAIKSTLTITIGGGKQGLYSYPAQEYTGEVTMVDIGLPLSLIKSPPIEITEENIYRGRLKRKDPNFHKGSGGHTGIIAGSRDKKGAAYIATIGSLRIGSGLTTLISEKEVIEGITQIHPEVMTIFPDFDNSDRDYFSRLFSGINTLVIGPGLSNDENVFIWTERLIQSFERFMVLDAEALKLIKDSRFNDNRVVITPHPLELAKILNIPKEDIQRDRISAAKSCASRFNVVCVLKGSRSIIASPDGRVTINTTGNPFMASGGMGDLLSGIIGGLIYQTDSTYDAARIGTYIHGLAADILVEQNKTPLLAGDVADALREAINRSGIYE